MADFTCPPNRSEVCLVIGFPNDVARRFVPAQPRMDTVCL
jgi:hypothetical protein